MQKLTLKKIAKELDVSISTVSKSLKDSPEIGEETKQKVKAFAELYNYRPNNIALSLKNQKTKTIGVIVPEIVHHFFTTVIKGIEQVANAKGYTVIVGLSNESFQKEVTLMDELANGSIDGFILSVSKETQKRKDYHHLSETIYQGMPIVMFDRALEEIDCDKVIVDDREGAHQAVRSLLQKGCKQIGLLTTKDHVNVGYLRTLGYQDALEEAGFTSEEKYILKMEDTLDLNQQEDRLFEHISEFLENNNHLDGIFAVNEIFALMALKALKQLGKEVPRDVKLIGFTDGVLSKYASPSLSTVSQHGERIGEEAAKLLINRIEEVGTPSNYATVTIATELIERETTHV